MAGIISDLVSTAGAAAGLYGHRVNVPSLTPIVPGATQQQTVSDNAAVLPAAEKLATSVNTFNVQELQRMLESAMPGYQGMMAKASSNASSLLSGQLPADVVQGVIDSAAARSVSGGFAGSGLSGNLTLRDLGLTSLQAENMGLSQFGQLFGMAESATPRPFDYTTMFLTPSQRLSFEMNQQQMQFRRDLLAAQSAAAPDPSEVQLLKSGGAVGDDVLSMFMGGMGAGGAGGMLGGMGGGGGGGFTVGQYMANPGMGGPQLNSPWGNMLGG